MQVKKSTNLIYLNAFSTPQKWKIALNRWALFSHRSEAGKVRMQVPYFHEVDIFCKFPATFLTLYGFWVLKSFC